MPDPTEQPSDLPDRLPETPAVKPSDLPKGWVKIDWALKKLINTAVYLFVKAPKAKAYWHRAFPKGIPARADLEKLLVRSIPVIMLAMNRPELDEFVRVHFGDRPPKNIISVLVRLFGGEVDEKLHYPEKALSKAMRDFAARWQQTFDNPDIRVRFVLEEDAENPELVTIRGVASDDDGFSYDFLRVSSRYFTQAVSNALQTGNIEEAGQYINESFAAVGGYCETPEAVRNAMQSQDV